MADCSVTVDVRKGAKAEVSAFTVDCLDDLHLPGRGKVEKGDGGLADLVGKYGGDGTDHSRISGILGGPDGTRSGNAGGDGGGIGEMLRKSGHDVR